VKQVQEAQNDSAATEEAAAGGGGGGGLEGASTSAKDPLQLARLLVRTSLHRHIPAPCSCSSTSRRSDAHMNYSTSQHNHYNHYPPPPIANSSSTSVTSGITGSTFSTISSTISSSTSSSRPLVVAAGSFT
jgi:hypothetical protein